MGLTVFYNCHVVFSISISLDINVNFGKETIAYINEKDYCRCINSEE